MKLQNKLLLGTIFSLNQNLQAPTSFFNDPKDIFAIKEALVYYYKNPNPDNYCYIVFRNIVKHIAMTKQKKHLKEESSPKNHTWNGWLENDEHIVNNVLQEVEDNLKLTDETQILKAIQRNTKNALNSPRTTQQDKTKIAKYVLKMNPSAEIKELLESYQQNEWNINKPDNSLRTNLVRTMLFCLEATLRPTATTKHESPLYVTFKKVLHLIQLKFPDTIEKKREALIRIIFKKTLALIQLKFPDAMKQAQIECKTHNYHTEYDYLLDLEKQNDIAYPNKEDGITNTEQEIVQNTKNLYLLMTQEAKKSCKNFVQEIKEKKEFLKTMLSHFEIDPNRAELDDLYAQEEQKHEQNRKKKHIVTGAILIGEIACIIVTGFFVYKAQSKKTIQI